MGNDELESKGHHAHDDHDHEHDHGRSGNSLVDWFRHQLMPHSHGHQAAALDVALSTERGLWAVQVSLIGLLATALFQVFVVVISGSVALLADTIHNFSDALTAIPLGLAFMLARRARNSRYTYGYGRAEDIAGTIIVLMIFASAVEVFYQSARKFIQPEPVGNLGWVAAAAVIGFLGNELVAAFRIRIGRQIGSAALVADGMHARTDGFTSLAVLAGVVGVWLGFPLADPLVGLGIGIAILFIVWESARDMYYRVMDAVDPQITALVEKTVAKVPDVMAVQDVRIRWVGHRQRAELHITVDCQMTTCDSHEVAEAVRHDLFHELPALVDVTIHVDPCECDYCDETHHSTRHHTTPAVAD